MAVAAAAAALCWPAFATAQPAPTPTHQDALVRDALARYREGLAALESRTGLAQTAIRPARGTRELRLEEAVELALAQNLDIAVERLNPQAVDLQIAGLEHTYRPLATTTIGQRDQVLLPTNQLNGGQRVNNATTTYNFGISQPVPLYGGNFSLTWNNSKLDTSNLFANFNPSFQTSLTAAYTQPLLRGLRIDNTRQQLLVTRINRDIAEENVRATVAATLANVRNAYWDLVFARSAVEVAERALQLAEKLVEDNRARVEVGTLAPLDIVQSEAEVASRRQILAQAEATLQTAELALKRFLVTGTEDPLWSLEIVPVDLPSLEAPPSDVEGAVRAGLSRRTDLVNARRNLDSADVSIRFFRNQALPALDLTASYGAQGLGGTQFIRQSSGLGSVVTGTIPGGYRDALALLGARDFPVWNVQLNLSYPIGGSQAEAQLARARVQRNQSIARLRVLELQVATEITNAALAVQSNFRRVEAARAARELAARRLEAEQSRFEVGLSTNFFVVQAQRDLRDAENTELRALADYRKSLVTFERAQEAPAGGGGGGGGFAAGGQQ
ncbi:MAG: TolC family protein [Acidobacteriota bacterium]